MRCFTAEGPGNCARYHCLPPLVQRNRPEVLLLSVQQMCFLLHAPRLTEKATRKAQSLRLGDFPRRATGQVSTSSAVFV
jgi:hypothetical protein